MRTKGIILAGGKGTRLFPSTIPVCKQLLPVYDKPMIYYPLSILMLAEIRDILIISTPEDIPRFKSLFKSGDHLGMNISYAIQDKPRGLADAFIIGEEFIGEDNVALILGDNLFYGNSLPRILREKINSSGATVFGYYVENPSEYGVVDYDSTGKVLSLEEKPKKPKSNYAVVGLYFYDNKVVEFAKNIKPSHRGELEITDVNKEYLKRDELNVIKLGRGVAWLDTGSHKSLLEASLFVEVIESRQGLKISCIEEIAYNMGYINREQFIKLGKQLEKSSYGKYLLRLIK